jgi:hypothetical protein
MDLYGCRYEAAFLNVLFQDMPVDKLSHDSTPKKNTSYCRGQGKEKPCEYFF